MQIPDGSYWSHALSRQSLPIPSTTAMNDALLHSLDFALHGGLVALMLFAAALVWRDHGRSSAGCLATALAIGIAAYAVQSTSAFMSLPPLAVLSTGNAVVFLLFSRALLTTNSAGGHCMASPGGRWH